jgi:dihydrofolate reductase
MSRIIMFNRVSADGYFAGLDGNLNWFVPDDDIDKAGAQSGPEFDTIVFGRRTYEMFASYWPHAVDESPHNPGRRSSDIGAMATFLNETPKLVFSKTLAEVTWKHARLLRDMDAIRAQPGKNMNIFGSGSIVSQLTEHALIDEYHVVVSPVFLGNGRPLLSGMAESARLELLEATPYRSGNVMFRWRRSPS